MNRLKNNDVKWAKGVVKELISNQLIDNLTVRKRDCKDYMYHNLALWRMEHNDLFRNLDIEVDYGANRICFISPHHDYVIKADIKRPLYNLSGCRLEELLYREAYKQNLSKYFVPLIKLLTIDGVTFYIQKKVLVDANYLEDEIRDTLEDVMPYHSFDNDEDYYEYTSNFIEDMEDREILYRLFNGEKNQEIERLIKFCCDNDIHDLHLQNIGIDSRNDYVILDYAGCHW